MILLPLLASATAITLGAFWLADRVLKRVHELNVADDPKAEKRRVLERERGEWLRAACGGRNEADRRVASEHVTKVDKQLLELADE